MTLHIKQRLTILAAWATLMSLVGMPVVSGQSFDRPQLPPAFVPQSTPPSRTSTATPPSVNITNVWPLTIDPAVPNRALPASDPPSAAPPIRLSQLPADSPIQLKQPTLTGDTPAPSNLFLPPKLAIEEGDFPRIAQAPITEFETQITAEPAPSIEPLPVPQPFRTSVIEDGMQGGVPVEMPMEMGTQMGLGHTVDEMHPQSHSPFSPDPDYSCVPYQPEIELGIYHGKWCVPVQRPLIELWRPLFAPGEIPPSPSLLGRKNLIHPHFLLYGDYRTAVAFNDNGGNGEETFRWAHRLNLDFDFKITATERIHAFWGPIDEDGRFTRVEENDGQIEFIEEFDDDFDTLYFEGDLGYIWGGLTDQYAPFDLPFVAGKYPLLFQNGVWMLDVLEGFAFTLPAKSSAFFDWTNFDLTFFFAYDDVDSPAFGNDDNAANAYGFNWFLEAYDGYWEIGYAFLEDETGQGRSYNNIGLAYSRRYFHRLSNSIRVIINAGQDPNDGVKTADGQLVLIENALISHDPLHFVPYLNMFAGFGNPQQVAGAGGILVNTGLNFESDGLTGFPTLDATANDTYGGALGINWLGPDFSWQLVTELAMVQTHGDDANRNAQNDQYAFGMRFQVPLTNAVLARFDSMYGIIENEPDVRGARMELRWKF
jgi:hypothetical protein